MPASPSHLSAAEGRRFVGRAFTAAGLPAADAETIAALMILADLRGIDSHGIVRLAPYVQRLRNGAINKTPSIKVLQDAPATALIDGDNGMGHLVMSHAAKLAIAKAKASGIGWVGVRGSNHAGAAACYPMLGLAHDMIGLYFAVADINHMAPWGGVEALLGTNPIAVAVPALEEPPMVLDIATTVASNGRVGLATQRKEPLGEGWAIDAEGKPLTDSQHAHAGTLLPIGGYKGYGLALVVSLLGGVLNGTPTGSAAGRTPDSKKAANTGQAIMMLDIARFAEPEVFKRAVDKQLRELRSSKPIPGGESVRYPGLGGDRLAREREAAGIPLPPEVVAALQKLAATLDIAPPTLS